MSSSLQSDNRRSSRGFRIWPLLLGALFCLACGLFFLVPPGGQLAAMDVTPLAELKEHVGDGKLVRVQARLVSDPAVTGPEGEELALQRVQVVQSGQDDKPEIVYDETAPGLLWANQGEQVIAVDPTDFDPGFLDAEVSTPVETKDEVPTQVQAALLPEFDDVPAPSGATIEVWNIEQGAEINIYGTVDLQDNQPILQAPPGQSTFIISSLDAQQIAARAGQGSLFERAFGWAFIVAGVLLALISLKKPRRKRDKLDLPH